MDEGINMLTKEKPHQCQCSKVTSCGIFVHPSKKVQQALNLLVEAMTEFDTQENSRSTLVFKSTHSTGTFTSVTRQK